MTQDEIAKAYKEYYDKFEMIYPVESFQIQGSDGQVLFFYHGDLPRRDKFLYYILVDEDHKKYLDQLKALNLQGKEVLSNEANRFKSRGFFSIDIENKVFNFVIDFDAKGKGYGTTVYNNISKIFSILGICNPDEYTVQVGSNSQHSFLVHHKPRKSISEKNDELDDNGR